MMRKVWQIERRRALYRWKKEAFMSLAFGIAMLAVVISLGVVFMSARSNAADKKRDGGDSSSVASSTSASDCSPSDRGSCDGGGGGGD